MGASIERAQKNSLTNQRVFEYKLFSDWVNRNLFNEHYTIFLEIGLKALLIQGFHDKIVIKKCNVYKMWVSFWVSFALKNVIVYLLL